MTTQGMNISGDLKVVWRHRESTITTLWGEDYAMTFYRHQVVTVNGKSFDAGRDDTPFQYRSADLKNIQFTNTEGKQVNGEWLAENYKLAIDSEIQKRVDAEDAAEQATSALPAAPNEPAAPLKQPQSEQ